MIRIENTEKLEAWLEENLKMPFGDYDINAVMDEIENQRGASGSNHYELRSWETKSGNPECSQGGRRGFYR